MKSTILLTLALFLISAPSPDSKTLTEMTAGFISIGHETALSASAEAPLQPFETEKVRQLVDYPESSSSETSQ